MAGHHYADVMNVCVYDENFFNLVSGVANLGWQVMAMALSVYHGGGAFVFKKEKYGFAWTAKVNPSLTVWSGRHFIIEIWKPG